MKKQLRTLLAATFAVLAVALAAPAVSASAGVSAQPDCVRPCHF